MADFEEAVEKIWNEFDKDKNGVLDKKELRPFVKLVCQGLPDGTEFDESEFEKLFADLDENGDGVISKEEIKSFLIFYFASMAEAK